MQQLVAAAIKHKVKRVAAAGDLLDRQTNRSGPVTYFHRELDKLEEADIEFIYLQGQHCSDDPPWLAGHRHAKHMHKQIVYGVGPYTAYGLDFQPFGKLQDELAEIPGDCDMLIAHQCWGDWMGDIAVPQGEFAQVPDQIKFLYTGDLHKWVLDKARNAGDEQMGVLSTGAVAKQKIDEPDEHYYAILTDDGNVLQKKLKSRVFIDWPSIIIQEDLTKFMEEIEDALAVAIQKAAAMDLPDEMCKPRLRVPYSYKLPETVRRINKILNDRAIIHWKELPPEEKSQGSGKKSKKSGGQAVTPLTVLPDEVNKDESPEVFELASRLLQSNNASEEFQRWWAEQMGEK